MATILAFERPVVELITRVRELRALASEDDRFGSELKRLEDKAATRAREVFAKLSPMQKVQLSRHPNRPYTNDYIDRLFTDFVELHGDRRFGEDGSLVAGIGKFHGRSVVVVGHQKGRNTKEQMKRNFGMANPEGYRKAIRMYELGRALQHADLHVRRHARCLPWFGRRRARPERSHRRGHRGHVDPHRAHHHHRDRRGWLGRRARARHRQSRAGARVQLLFGDHSRRLRGHSVEERRARARRRGSPTHHRAHLLEFGIADTIVEEPPGGAHQDHDDAAKRLDRVLYSTLRELSALSREDVREDRYQRFRKLGAYVA